VSNYEKAIKDVTVRLTIGSIVDVLRVFKEDNDRNTDYGAGYDDGLDQAIKAVQLFLKVLEKDQEDNTIE
jgi:hypothetical protein